MLELGTMKIDYRMQYCDVIPNCYEDISGYLRENDLKFCTL